MMNMKIYKELLKCAYDLDILHFEQSETIIYNNGNKKEIEQGCYILTNHGDLEIYTTEKFVMENGKIVVSLLSKFKSNIFSIETDFIRNLIKTQLETEAFLGFENYKDIFCSCELIC